jgi:hypothetical protein
MAQGRLSSTPRSLLATVGDDWAHKITLYEDGVLKDVSSASDISVALQDHGGWQVIAPTACASGATGAAWATGVVVLPFTAATTVLAWRASTLSRQNEYLLELQVTLGGLRETWPLIPVLVQNGIIP